MSDNQTSYDFLDKTGLERLVEKIKMDFGNTNYEVAEYDESVALYSHSVDEFVYFNGGLYKVTNAINVGDSIAVGVNITSDTGIEDESIIFIKNIEDSGDNYNAVFILKSGSLQEYGNTKSGGSSSGGHTIPVSYTILASGWDSNGVYSFESDYPSSRYNITDILPNENTPASARGDWENAGCDGYYTTNIIKANGNVPIINIPVTLFVEEV